MGNVLCPSGNSKDAIDSPTNSKSMSKQETVAKPVPWFVDGQELVVLSLNMEYYHKFCAATDETSYKAYLQKSIEGVDALCVQEDLLFWSNKFLEEDEPFHDFRRIASSTDQPGINNKNSMLKDMVYETPGTMELMKKNGMTSQEFDSILGNSIYLNKKSKWNLTDTKVVQISTKMTLPNGKPLGYRSVVCATLKHDKTDRPVQVLCTHLSGGRFEDVYMTGAMRDERANQMKNCFKEKKNSADNVLVGDFNASVTRTAALDGYLDLLRKGDQPELSTSDYYSYMMSPFTTLSNDKKKNWNLLYKDLHGPTSGFGHAVDFFMTSPQMHVQTPFKQPPKIERIRMIKDYMPWIKPTADEDFAKDGNPDDMEQSITDHNGVKVTFFQPRRQVIAADITFTADDAVWAQAVKDKMWDEKMNALKTVITRAESGENDQDSTAVYPIIEHAESEDGPTLSREESLENLIIKAQKPAFEKFLESPTVAAFETFMKDGAAEERQVLVRHGWRIPDDWYTLKKNKSSFHFDEKMTAAHKSLHGSVLSVCLLRDLLAANMLIRD